jgi:hypothetical protein
VLSHVGTAAVDRRERSLISAVSDHRNTLEEAAILPQHEQVAEAVLRGVSGRAREILTRFYLMEHEVRRVGKKRCYGESFLRGRYVREHYLV